MVALTLQQNNLPQDVEGGQHITVLYFGHGDEGEFLTEALYSELLDAVSTAVQNYRGDGKIKTKGLDTLGPEADAHVLLLDDTSKSLPVQFRNAILKEMSPELFSAFKEAETYPVYNPHVTLGYASEGFTLPDDLEVPKELFLASVGVWHGGRVSQFALHAPIEHYGILRKSGRYPWGSGANPYQRSRRFLQMYESLRAQGLTPKQIAQGFGMDPETGKDYLNTREMRQHVAMAKAQVKKEQIATARRLRDRGWTNVKIGEHLGIGESSVRALLDPDKKAQGSKVENTVAMLKEELDQGIYLDFGRGSEFHMAGVTRHTLDDAIAWLRDEGYEVKYIKTPILGSKGKMTTSKVLTPPGTEYNDVTQNKDRIRAPGQGTDDGGITWAKPKPPKNLDSDRIAVRYGPDGGADKDGIIEIRPGAKDLDLGNARYAQVRIAVDGTHYLKGVAHYSDNLPDGVDVIFNTNKKSTGNPFDSMKPMSDDPANPWGAVIKEGGQRGALNIINEEGDWEEWSKKLSSQMLSKQPMGLAKEQLALTYDLKKAEYDEIVTLTNPTIKRHLLEKFADGADSAAVNLKAHGLPRTANHVLLPVPNMKPTEIFAPNYNNGDRVVLIRHPHAGRFEIPELTVNNNSRTARKIMGNDAVDAVGIHPSVAEQLSGADFDGDTVLVIPNPRGKKGIQTQSPLKGLEGFDAKVQYGHDEVRIENGKEVLYRQGVPFKAMTNTQTEMGQISNLITDMSLRDATQDEMARAVRHSMVVIDAEKHGLDYKQSYDDNKILALKKRYQAKTDGKGRAGGASTLISKAKADLRVPEIALARVGEGGPINPKTGEKVYVPTGKMRPVWAKDPVTGKKTVPVIDPATGVQKETPVLTKTTPMAYTNDAHTLSSGTGMESVYADHANKLKALANQARLEMLATPRLKYNTQAFEAYRPEVQSLNAQLNIAKSNAPLERQAQILAGHAVQQKKMANPNMDDDDVKKEERKALALYRTRVGADKQRITIKPREWEAIQAGAISDSKLQEILANTDLDQVKALATPRVVKGMPPALLSRAQAMIKGGYTQAQVADALGVSVGTLSNALKG